ncbi:pyrroline-5-carboxylate reductase [Phyllobacterium leguminum]|uniref:Pyrroline-5-carboxylate reductase n=1 Tax=Phyllobacterium leguminum TaxID=314237 RepID=A0A318SWP7_9HYPH|nr:pyrroline-5-carboxylate reductase [Phyllobacterium leguminum]PYE86391.1 pyrroline-5-carboxylate reductase [Phyllobacterium leguminum]
MSDRVVLVGCGNMGFAMLKGWLDSGALEPQAIHVVEPAAMLRQRAGELGVHTVAEAGELSADLNPRMVLIAVKPQAMAQVLPAYTRFAGDVTFVSVAAGIPVALFEKHLGDKAAIMRVMPNTPAAIGKGMLVVYRNAHVTDANAVFINGLLKTSGEVASIADESLMDAVTAISGSGPAYVFHFIECLTDAGVTVGLDRDLAALLAMQTVYGAGALAAQSHESPTKLREQVTSPNGTTAAALDVLMSEDRLEDLITKAVEAAKKRSVELGKA